MEPCESCSVGTYQTFSVCTLRRVDGEWESLGNVTVTLYHAVSFQYDCICLGKCNVGGSVDFITISKKMNIKINTFVKSMCTNYELPVLVACFCEQMHAEAPKSP